MAFGIGKAFKKGWKKTLGWADDDWAKQAAITAVAGAVTGGLGAGLVAGGLSWAAGAGLGALGGAIAGGTQGYQAQQQEKSVKAQVASAEKIAAMQNNTVVSAAPIPTQTVQQAAISEQNEATRKARAFRLSNSVRNSTLGGGMGGRKKVLG